MSDKKDNKEEKNYEEVKKFIENCLQKLDKSNINKKFEEIIKFINEKCISIENIDNVAYILSDILIKHACDKFENINIILEIIFMLTVRIDSKFTSNDYPNLIGGKIFFEHVNLQIAEYRNGPWTCMFGSNKLLNHLKYVYEKNIGDVFPDNPVIKGNESDEEIVEYIDEINNAREKNKNFWIFYTRLEKCVNDETNNTIINDLNFIYDEIENNYKNDNMEVEIYIEEICAILNEYGSELKKYKNGELMNKYFDMLKIFLKKSNISLDIKNCIAQTLKSKINNFKNQNFEELLKNIWLKEFRKTINK